MEAIGNKRTIILQEGTTPGARLRGYPIRSSSVHDDGDVVLVGLGGVTEQRGQGREERAGEVAHQVTDEVHALEARHRLVDLLQHVAGRGGTDEAREGSELVRREGVAVRSVEHELQLRLEASDGGREAYLALAGVLDERRRYDSLGQLGREPGDCVEEDAAERVGQLVAVEHLVAVVLRTQGDARRDGAVGEGRRAGALDGGHLRGVGHRRALSSILAYG
jgi:hypothetical protein